MGTRHRARRSRLPRSHAVGRFRHGSAQRTAGRVHAPTPAGALEGESVPSSSELRSRVDAAVPRVRALRPLGGHGGLAAPAARGTRRHSASLPWAARDGDASSCPPSVHHPTSPRAPGAAPWPGSVLAVAPRKASATRLGPEPPVPVTTNASLACEDKPRLTRATPAAAPAPPAPTPKPAKPRAQPPPSCSPRRTCLLPLRCLNEGVRLLEPTAGQRPRPLPPCPRTHHA